MKMNLYVIKDDCIGEFSFWKPAVNDEVAKRDFRIAIDAPNIPVTDLSLYRLGIYDTVTGNLESDLVFLEKGVRHEV